MTIAHPLHQQDHQIYLMYPGHGVVESSRPDVPAPGRPPLRWRLLAGLADSDLRVRELVTLVDQPQTWSPTIELRRPGRYYHLDLDRCAEALAGTGVALHPALHPSRAAPTSQPADTDQTSYPAFTRAAAEIDTRIRHLLPILTTNRKETRL